MQYTRNDIDFRRATFRVRGDVIDIYPADSERDALRIELFGDEVERLLWIDPLTGEVINETPRATIYPKTHYVTPKETILDCLKTVREELKERIKYLKVQIFELHELTRRQQKHQPAKFPHSFIV